VTDIDPTAPIRKGMLPCTPPPEWEFHTVYGARTGTDGCALFPGDAGPAVVRRLVTYGDWEPVRPDRWAEEPPTGAAAAPAVQAPATDRAALRDRIAEALDATYISVDDFDAERAADAVLAVLPAPTDRAAVLREAAERLRERAGTCTSTAFQVAFRAAADGLDCDADEAQPAAEVRCTCADAGACFAPAGHYADCPAAGAQQPKEPLPVVAYNDGMGAARVFCIACPRPEDVDVPLTINDVEDWDLCPSCGRHVVDVARAADEAQQPGESR
jgi:hypothetical protein